MHCIECGCKTDAKAKYCSECGAAIEDEHANAAPESKEVPKGSLNLKSSPKIGSIVLILFLVLVGLGALGRHDRTTEEETASSDAGVFIANITCEISGQKLTPLACFKGTQLKIRDGNGVRVFNQWDLGRAGWLAGNRLEIRLTHDFEISAQNGADDFIIGLSISKASGGVVYEDKEGPYGVVSASN